MSASACESGDDRRGHRGQRSCLWQAREGFVPAAFTRLPWTLSKFRCVSSRTDAAARRGFAAWSVSDGRRHPALPCQTPGLEGIAQLPGPNRRVLGRTAGAFTRRWIIERTNQERTTRLLRQAAVSGRCGQRSSFASGLNWLAVLTHSVAKAVYVRVSIGFLCEIIKVMFDQRPSTAIRSRPPGTIVRSLAYTGPTI